MLSLYTNPLTVTYLEGPNQTIRVLYTYLSNAKITAISISIFSALSLGGVSATLALHYKKWKHWEHIGSTDFSFYNMPDIRAKQAILIAANITLFIGILAIITTYFEMYRLAYKGAHFHLSQEMQDFFKNKIAELIKQNGRNPADFPSDYWKHLLPYKWQGHHANFSVRLQDFSFNFARSPFEDNLGAEIMTLIFYVGLSGILLGFVTFLIAAFVLDPLYSLRVPPLGSEQNDPRFEYLKKYFPDYERYIRDLETIEFDNQRAKSAMLSLVIKVLEEDSVKEKLKSNIEQFIKTKLLNVHLPYDLADLCSHLSNDNEEHIIARFLGKKYMTHFITTHYPEMEETQKNAIATYFCKNSINMQQIKIAWNRAIENEIAKQMDSDTEIQLDKQEDKDARRLAKFFGRRIMKRFLDNSDFNALNYQQKQNATDSLLKYFCSD